MKIPSILTILIVPAAAHGCGFDRMMVAFPLSKDCSPIDTAYGEKITVALCNGSTATIHTDTNLAFFLLTHHNVCVCRSQERRHGHKPHFTWTCSDIDKESTQDSCRSLGAELDGIVPILSSASSTTRSTSAATREPTSAESSLPSHPSRTTPVSRELIHPSDTLELTTTSGSVMPIRTTILTATSDHAISAPTTRFTQSTLPSPIPEAESEPASCHRNPHNRTIVIASSVGVGCTFILMWAFVWHQCMKSHRVIQDERMETREEDGLIHMKAELEGSLPVMTECETTQHERPKPIFLSHFRNRNSVSKF